MKILIVTDYHNQTGSGKQNYQLLLGLRALWHEAEIMNLVSRQGFRKIPDYGVNVVSKHFLLGVFRDFQKGLHEHLEGNRYDAVFLWQHGLAYLKGAIESTGHVPVLLLADLFPIDWRYTNRFDPRFWIYAVFMFRGYDRFENVVFISKYTEGEYFDRVGRLPKHSAVIHIGTGSPSENGSDAVSTVDWDSEFEWKKVVLQVWSSDKRKNAETFFEIARKFQDSNGLEDVVFARVGYTSDALKKSASSNVKFYRWISEGDLRALYRHSHVFVFTSLAEGYGMPVVEARMLGVPVVSSKISDMADIFKEDGLSFFVDDPKDAESYCRMIRPLLEVKKSEVPSTALAEKLSVPAEVAKYLAFFRELT